MTSLLLLLSLAGADDPCKGVLDRTPQCTSPSSVAATLPPDRKPPPAPIPGIDPKALPGELGLIAAGLAVGGGAAIGFSFVGTERIASPDDIALRERARYGGIGLLAASGLAASAAFTFAVFDPSTGKLRIDSLEKEGS